MVASSSSSDKPRAPERVEEMKRRRRRQRWSAFLTPLITQGSVVISIGLLIFSWKLAASV